MQVFLCFPTIYVIIIIILIIIVIVPMQGTVLSARAFLRCLLFPLSTGNSFPQVIEYQCKWKNEIIMWWIEHPCFPIIALPMVTLYRSLADDADWQLQTDFSASGSLQARRCISLSDRSWKMFFNLLSIKEEEPQLVIDQIIKGQTGKNRWNASVLQIVGQIMVIDGWDWSTCHFVW